MLAAYRLMRHRFVLLFLRASLTRHPLVLIWCCSTVRTMSSDLVFGFIPSHLVFRRGAVHNSLVGLIFSSQQIFSRLSPHALGLRYFLHGDTPSPPPCSLLFVQMLTLYCGCEVLGYVKSVQDVGTDDVDLNNFTRDQVIPDTGALLACEGASRLLLCLQGRIYASCEPCVRTPCVSSLCIYMYTRWMRISRVGTVANCWSSS